jgi:predicted nucleic acid-binding protein
VTREIAVDASVLIASVLTSDRFHLESDRFLEHAAATGVALLAPAFLLVELTCVLARRSGDAERGRSAALALLKRPDLSLEPMSEEQLVAAAQFGAELRLRSSDALYVAVASEQGVPLVSWDRELIARAGAITPTDGLAQHA